VAEVVIRLPYVAELLIGSLVFFFDLNKRVTHTQTARCRKEVAELAYHY
jgi:hypothetical protein